MDETVEVCASRVQEVVRKVVEESPKVRRAGYSTPDERGKRTVSAVGEREASEESAEAQSLLRGGSGAAHWIEAHYRISKISRLRRTDPRPLNPNK